MGHLWNAVVTTFLGTCREISLRVQIVHLNRLLLVEACVDVCGLRHNVCVDCVVEVASASHGRT